MSKRTGFVKKTPLSQPDSVDHQLRKTPWSNQRGRTPKTRNLTEKRKRFAEEQFEVPELDNDNKAAITNKTWSLYRLSPLYDFQTDRLKQYSKQLSAHINAAVKKGVAVIVDVPDIKGCKAVFSMLPGLQVTTQDAEAIQITVSSNAQGKNSKILLQAILCCVQCPQSVLNKVHKDFTFYPMMLVKGTAGLTEYTISWLQSEFDCYVSPLTFSAIDLSWMMAMWSGFVREDGKNKKVECVYRTPKDVEGLSKITINIESADCKRLWDCIHKSGSDEFSLHEVEIFVDALSQHFFAHFQMSFKVFCLERVCVASAMVGSNGKLKIFMQERLVHILRHICELAIEKNPIDMNK